MCADWRRSAAQGAEVEFTAPLVTLTYAQSLDGSIAAADGSAVLISGKESMHMTHALRAAHDAILVGVGTVRNDDPSLTVRLCAGSNPQVTSPHPHRFSLSSSGVLWQREQSRQG